MAITSHAAAQKRAETRYAADFADPCALPSPATPAGMTPAATTCDLAAGTVRDGRYVPGAAAAGVLPALVAEIIVDVLITVCSGQSSQHFSLGC